ncbi:hypothetical protein ABZ758_51430, partial [Streptomyces sp. NPDC006668]
PGDALAATAASDLEFVSSVPFGGAYVLDHLWHRLRIDQIVGRVGQPKRGRRRDMTATERVLFALVANRALAPSSKLATGASSNAAATPKPWSPSPARYSSSPGT